MGYMLKSFTIKQLKLLGEASGKRDFFYLIASFLLLIFMNALKVSVFNYCIIQRQTADVFEYKLKFTLLVGAAACLILVRVRSRLVLIGIYLLQTVYIVVNLSYYAYFHSYLHITDILMLFNEGITAAIHAAAPQKPYFLLVFIDLPVFIYIMRFYGEIRALHARLSFFKTAAVTVCIFALISLEINNYIEKHSIFIYANDNHQGESPVVERYGTLAVNLINLLSEKSEKDLLSSFSYGRKIALNGEKELPPNIVMIQIEAMDSNIVNMRHGNIYVMPFLHLLSEKCVYYPYMLSYHMGGGTSDAEFSVINSVQPLDDYPAVKISNYDYPNSFVKSLSGNGYASAGFHGNVGNYYNRDVAFPRMGFNFFYDLYKMNLSEVGWGAPDDKVFGYAARIMGQLKKPFLTYIISMTSHGPFTNASYYYKNTLFHNIKSTTVRNYFNSMSYVDSVLKEFIERVLREHENTYIFIWGDHGPNINTDEYRQASFTAGDDHLEFVPLLIITPDNKIFKENSCAVSFLDILPTVMNASGKVSELRSDGIDLLGLSLNICGIPYKEKILDRKKLYIKADRVKYEIAALHSQ